MLRKFKSEAEQILVLQTLTVSLWRKACLLEGVDPSSRFVVLSPDNRFAVQHNWAMGRFLKLRVRSMERHGHRMQHVA